MSVLVLAEHDNETLNVSTKHVVTAARLLSDEVVVLVAGYNCKQVAESVSKLQGVNQVYLADNACYEHFLAENLSVLVGELLEGKEALMAPASTFGKDVLPRVAAVKDVVQVSDVTKIIDNHTFEHPIYAGNAVETIKVNDALKVLTIRTPSFEAAPAGDTAVKIEVIDVMIPANHTQFNEASKPESSRPELTSANCVVSGGRGLQSAEQFKIIEELADTLNAAVGASRAAVDAGYISNDHQVGQTGKIVAPNLYIAVGISGAVQHLAGIKDSKIIVAINKDEEAPIFQVADYGLVGDLFTVVPELIRILKQSKE